MTVATLERRAAKVSLVTGLSTVLTITFQLIAVPVCLRFWGAEIYGAWLALFAAFMLLRSLESGYVNYVGNRLNLLYHHNSDELRLHLASAAPAVGLIGLCQFALALAALASDGLSSALGISSADGLAGENGIGLLVLVVSWVLTGSYLGIVHRLLVPAGMMYQAAWWSTLFQVVQFGTLVVVALLQLSILQASVSFALTQVIIYLASAIFVRRQLPTYFPWWRGGCVSIGLRDLGRSILMTASNLIQQGSTNGVVLLVAAMSGPGAVPMFTTVRTLTNLWASVTNVLSTPLLPDVVRFHANDEPDKLAAVNQAYWVVVGNAVNMGLLLTYPLLLPLYGSWTAHALELDKTLLCMLMAAAAVTNAGALMAMHLNGINSLRVVLCISVTRGVLALGGGVWWYVQLNLTSFGLGILAGELAAFAIILYSFNKIGLLQDGVKRATVDCRPVILATGVVLLFFTCEGFGWVPTVWTLPTAVAAVASVAAWGWQGLEADIRSRLIDLIPRRF